VILSDVAEKFLSGNEQNDHSGDEDKPNAWLQTVKVIHHMLHVYILVIIISKV
jgi:hypothetical protein